MRHFEWWACMGLAVLWAFSKTPASDTGVIVFTAAALVISAIPKEKKA